MYRKVPKEIAKLTMAMKRAMKATFCGHNHIRNDALEECGSNGGHTSCLGYGGRMKLQREANDSVKVMHAAAMTSFRGVSSMVAVPSGDLIP